MKAQNQSSVFEPKRQANNSMDVMAKQLEAISKIVSQQNNDTSQMDKA
jgi:hypothetical protein